MAGSKKLISMVLIGVMTMLSGCVKSPIEEPEITTNTAVESTKQLLQIDMTDEYKKMVEVVGHFHMQNHLQYPDYDSYNITPYADMLNKHLYSAMTIQHELYDQKVAEQNAIPVEEVTGGATSSDMTMEEIFENMTASEYDAYIEEERQKHEGGYYSDENTQTHPELPPIKPLNPEQVEEFVEAEKAEIIEQETPVLVYSAYYSDLVVLRFKAKNGLNMTLHMEGNPTDGILAIKEISR